MAKFSYPQEDIFIRSYQPVVQGHIGQIKKAVQMLASAKRPIVYFGGGVVLGNASDELTQFVRMTGVPCTGTLMGLGAYPSSDRQFLGMLGMHGTYEANLAMQNADVVLAIGARFDDRVVSVPSKFLDKPKKIIHIDIDPSSIAKRVKVDIPIVGDVKNVLTEMTHLWGKQETAPSADSLDNGGKALKNGVRATACGLKTTAKSLNRNTLFKNWQKLPKTQPLLLQTLANTKCLPLNIIHSSVPANGSIPAVWVRWV